jgi:DNA-binding CsgD family transcriptional regulator
MNVSDIDGAIQQLRTESADRLKKQSLTNAQIEVLRLLAEGRSNREIAQARNTSVRAVETLLKRSLLRISDELPPSARAKMALAQRYLGWKP